MAEVQVVQRHGRWRVQLGERLIAAYSVGHFRSYIYPLLTPAGLPVTEESPVDHPHHQSVWLGQDRINGHNLWLNCPGCGRIESVELNAQISPDQSATFRQRNHWLAPNNELLLTEWRTVTLAPGEAGGRPLLIDIDSRRVASAGEVWFGMTKEAGLGIRVHDTLDGEDGGVIVNAQGGRGEAGTFDQDSNWVDYSGRLGHFKVGIALFPHPSNRRCPWFTRDYGIILFNPFRFEEVVLPLGGEIRERYRIVVHDGDHQDADIDGLYREYVREAED